MICSNLLDFRDALPTGGRLIGLDVGTKTIGVGLCDAQWTIATAAELIRRTKFAKDLEALRALIAAQQIADYGGQLTSADDLSGLWAAPDADLAGSTWLVFDGNGRAIAYADLRATGGDWMTAVSGGGLAAPAQRHAPINASWMKRPTRRTWLPVASFASARRSGGASSTAT